MNKVKYLGKELLITERAANSMGSFSGKINSKGYAGLREGVKIKRFLQQCNPEKHTVVLDIGSNYGSYSYITLFNNNIEVHAFEPNTEVVQEFNTILTTNRIPNVSVHPMGLSNSIFNAELSFPTFNVGMGKLSSIKKHKNRIQNCRFTTLDSFNLQQVDVVKIDVEGHELEVLEGAKETFMRCKPKFLQIEINSGDVKNKVETIHNTYFPEYKVIRDGADDWIFFL